MNSNIGKSQRGFIYLLFLGIISVVLFLGFSLFNTKGEPREAVVALSMLQSGDWVSPINNGVDIAYKPPFFHWCVALCSLFTGCVTEFTARFPSAIATIAMVLTAYCYMLRNRVDGRLALLSGMITLTAFEVHRASMACRVDMMLSALMVMAVYSFHCWYVSRGKWHLLLTVLLLSGAFLTKGPVGALLPCMVMGVYMLVRGERFFSAFFKCVAVVLASCILPLCWYYAAYLERGDAFLYLVYEENVLRFTGKMVYSSHEAPAIYNVMTMITGFLPYTLFILFSLFVVLRRRYRLPENIRQVAAGVWHRFRGMSDQDLLSLISAVLIFVFYCIPKSKRSVYLLPVYPFAAYYIARYILWVTGRHRSVATAYGWLLSAIAVVLPVLVLVIKTGVVPHSIFHGKHAAENVAFLMSLETMPIGLLVVLLTIIILLAVFFFVRARRRSDAYVLCYSLCGLVFSIYLMLDGVVLPRVLNVKSDYYVATEIDRLIPSGEKIWDYRSDWKPGDRNRMHQFSVNFYLNDRVVPLDLHRPKCGYMIMGDEDYDAFRKSFPQYRLDKVRRFDHRSCDDKRRLTLYRFERIAGFDQEKQVDRLYACR